MPAQDTSKIKEQILFILKKRGPSLPVHIARETGLSILFSSAFLSELVSEKKIKISSMRIGSSPVYFIQEQRFMLSNFSQHLKSKEKDAFALIKEKKFLRDKEQEPAIRVALRAIKDFAIPFKKNDEIFWRYFTVPETDLKIKEKPKREIKKEAREEKPKELGIFDKKPKRKTTGKKISQKKNNKFFNKVKEHLLGRSIEILDIESFSKNDLFLRIRENGEEKLLAAYNKKRIGEKEIMQTSKKASDLNLDYVILSLGEPLKKLTNLLKAVKNLSKIEKIE